MLSKFTASRPYRVVSATWRWTKWSMYISTFASIGVGYYYYKKDEGIARSILFSAYLTPMTCSYSYNMWKYKDATKDVREKAMEELHTFWAPDMLRIILKMRGYYIKAAQMCVGASLLPKKYDETLKCLLDEVPPRDYETIKAIIEAEIGKPIDTIFASFEKEAIAAASIGQVHKATLQDGSKIVVKVQYPEVEKFFTADMQMCKIACMACGYDDFSKMMDEFAKSFEDEFDYRREANNMRVCADGITSFP
jgi:predicted unusual protein kinase regulating ubiquinone biosynthesis (AarF/ABC1/UbiB family)